MCGAEVSQTQTNCPACGSNINSQDTSTGDLTNYSPDAAKPKFVDPTKNIQLANVLFDSKNKRFIVAKSKEEPLEPSYEVKEKLKEEFPELKEVPRADDNLKGKEHKLLAKPKFKHKDISDACSSLAIDG